MNVTNNLSVGGNLTVSGAISCGAQQIYAWPTNSNNTGYVNIGTWTIPSNAGYMLDIKMWLHAGYNAAVGQIQVVECVLAASNGSSYATTGSGVVATGSVLATGAATYYSKLGGATPTASISGIVVVQNSATSFTVWAQGITAYEDYSMYQITYGPGSSWINTGIFQTGAPSYGSNYITITPQAT